MNGLLSEHLKIFNFQWGNEYEGHDFRIEKTTAESDENYFKMVKGAAKSNIKKLRLLNEQPKRITIINKNLSASSWMW